MAVPVELVGSCRADAGRGVQEVTSDGEATVRVSDPNPKFITTDELTRKKQYVANLKSAAGVSDMSVTGSPASPVDFFVESQQGRVIWIERLRVEVRGEDMDLDSKESRQFSTVNGTSPLANGLTLLIRQAREELTYWPSNWKVMGDLDVLFDTPLLRINAIDVGIDRIVADWVFPAPIVLPAGNDDRLTMRVQDDLNVLNFFLQAIVYGWSSDIT